MDFAYKATLTATVVAMVMLAARAFGPRVAGLLAGLPYTTVPTLVWTGMELGPAMAARVAAGSVTGCAVVVAFAVVYEMTARRCSPGVASLLGLAALLGAAWLAWACDASLPIVVAVAVIACLAALAALGREPQAVPPPRLRPGAAVAMTAIAAGAVSALASVIALDAGPLLAGLLAALPVVGVLTLTAEHAASGAASVTSFLRGYLVSLLGRVAFGTAFAVSAIPGGIVNALGVGLLAGGLCCLAGTRWLDRSSPRRARA